MAGKKKNDFWDEPEEVEVVSGSPGANQGEGETDNEEWSAVKSRPLKAVMRVILMISCLTALFCAYVAYDYYGDRSGGGSFSTDFYDSTGFAEEYNKSMDQLLLLIEAMEDDSSVTSAGNEEILSTLVENYMGRDTNFSFMILDSDNYKIASSGDDAKSRIESSTHYAVISNVNGTTQITSPISGNLLEKDYWSAFLSRTSNSYIIYTAVDEELTQMDGFYTALQDFDKMQEYFTVARVIGIAALAVFIVCLIFCIVATGMKRGYDGVCLSWFDRIYTEIALIIMFAVGAVIIFGVTLMMSGDGLAYQIASAVLIAAAYVWIIRSYFSIVRRIKAGQLFHNSVTGCAARAIGRLPSPFNIIVGVLCLVAINGALAAGVIFLRQYTVGGIPVIYIVAAVVLVIELLALIVHGLNGDDEEDEEEEEEEAAAPEAVSEYAEEDEPVIPDETDKDSEDQMDWESLDLGKAIEEAEKASRAKEREDVKMPGDLSGIISDEEADSVKERPDAAIHRSVPEWAEESDSKGETQVLSLDEVRKALQESGLTPRMEGEAAAAAAGAAAVKNTSEEDNADADEDLVNFVQLNKEVRREFRPALKNKGITVTVRSPEKPVIADADSESLHMIITDIFKQIERLSENDSRTYIEIYVQEGKVIYIVRIPVAADAMESAQKAAQGDGSFSDAKKITEANGGRFVVTLDGNTLKAGMMIDAGE